MSGSLKHARAIGGPTPTTSQPLLTVPLRCSEERCDGADYFGTPGDAMFTMVQVGLISDVPLTQWLQILTLEWAGVVRAVLLYNGYCWPLFIAFLLLCSFSMVGIITGTWGPAGGQAQSHLLVWAGVIVTAIMEHRATEHWINPDLPGPGTACTVQRIHGNHCHPNLHCNTVHYCMFRTDLADPPETSSKCDDSPSCYLRRVDDVFRREDDEISESPRNRPLSSDDEDDLT